MRRTSTIILVSLFIYLLSFSGAWADATLSLENQDPGTGPTWQGSPGATAIVQLSMSDTVLIRGGQMDIQFDYSLAGIATLDSIGLNPDGDLVQLLDPRVESNLEYPNSPSDIARLLFFDMAADSLVIANDLQAIINLYFTIANDAPVGETITMTIIPDSTISI